MGLELYFSNQIESLAEKLSDNLDHENHGKANIFQGPVVIVPNMNLSKWIKLKVASKNGIFMNVNFIYLESGLWKLLDNLDPGSDEKKVFDVETGKIFLFYLLNNIDADKDAFGPISAYLLDSKQNKPEDFQIKAWQLAEHLARLFQEYEYHRSGMIGKWVKGGLDQTTDEMEACQKKLYNLMCSAKDEYAAESGLRFLSISEYAQHLIFNGNRSNLINQEPMPVVHFFGLSQISDFHLKLIYGLKTYYRIFIYAFNPSKEFWEDVKTPWEKKWLKRKNVRKLHIASSEVRQGELFKAPEDTLLSLWGKTGRESIRLLCALTEYDFNACYAPVPDRKSVLKSIQSNVLTINSETDTSEKIDQDRSLQILAVPGRRREVETVYNSILYNLKADDTLALTDIAILVPDIKDYRPFFDSVLNREPGRISYNIVDTNAGIESVYGRAVLSILSLSHGRFSRKQVFDLMLNPCFMKKWHLDRRMIMIWSKWAESLNIFHTFEKNNPVQHNPCEPEGGVHSWLQGLIRLRLSRVMTHGFFEHDDIPRDFKGLFPYEDVDTGDIDILEPFCEIIETLNRAVKSLQMKQAGVDTWKTALVSVCDQLLEIPDNLSKEKAIKQSLENAFERFRVYDALSRIKKQGGIGPEAVNAFIKSQLGLISGGTGDYLTGGVTISALMPMRPIPFKIVYVLGMEEGAFPGRHPNSSLDLRLKKRRIGDVSIPDKNRYLFLEMILSVKNKLYISYVSKDLQKDKTFEPCSVVIQLIRYVEEQILKRGSSFRICKVPLKGSDVTYMNNSDVSNVNDCIINYSKGDRINLFRSVGLWDHFISKASEKEKIKAGEFMPDFSISTVMENSNTKTDISLQAWQLKRFLLDPVRWKMEKHLNIYDDPEQIETLAGVEEEPLFLQFPVDYTLKIDATNNWMTEFFSQDRKKPDVETFRTRFYQSYDGLFKKGYTAEGTFSDNDRDFLEKQNKGLVKSCARVLERISHQSRLYKEIIIGESPGFEKREVDPDEIKCFPAYSLEVEYMDLDGSEVKKSVMINGHLPWVWEDEEENVNAIVITGARKGIKAPGRTMIYPVITSLLLAAGVESNNWLKGRAITFHLIYQENIKWITCNFTQTKARAWFNTLVSDCFNPSTFHQLPFEPVIAALKALDTSDPELKTDEQKLFLEKLENRLQESDDLLIEISGARIPENALEIANERFGVFLNPSGLFTGLR